MSAATSTPGTNSRHRERQDPLDDTRAAKVLIDVQRSQVAPPKVIEGRLDHSRREGVLLAEQDGTAGVDRWPTIGDEAFYGIAGKIVKAADPHTEADPVGVLIQLLAGFANAVGRSPHWVVDATAHDLALFVALVGRTAFARKGTSWKVDRFFLGHADETWVKNRIKSGMSSGEGLIFHVRDKVTGLDKNNKEVVVGHGVDDKRLLLIEGDSAGPSRRWAGIPAPCRRSSARPGTATTPSRPSRRTRPTWPPAPRSAWSVTSRWPS